MIDRLVQQISTPIEVVRDHILDILISPLGAPLAAVTVALFERGSVPGADLGRLMVHGHTSHLGRPLWCPVAKQHTWNEQRSYFSLAGTDFRACFACGLVERQARRFLSRWTEDPQAEWRYFAQNVDLDRWL